MEYPSYIPEALKAEHRPLGLAMQVEESAIHEGKQEIKYLREQDPVDLNEIYEWRVAVHGHRLARKDLRKQIAPLTDEIQDYISFHRPHYWTFPG